MKKLTYIPDTVTLEFSGDTCTGCGMCIIVCPQDVFTMNGGKAQVTDRDSCMECGACEKNCAFGAISVKSGVGCAAGVLNGFFRGTEPTCDCSEGSSCCG